MLFGLSESGADFSLGLVNRLVHGVIQQGLYYFIRTFFLMLIFAGPFYLAAMGNSTPDCSLDVSGAAKASMQEQPACGMIQVGIGLA